MGFFSKLFAKNNTSHEKINSISEKDKLFIEQGIHPNSTIDQDTLERIYNALFEENYDTYDEFNMKDALSTLDANVYNLIKAVIYQNFMLQRRIDELSNKIDTIIECENK